MASGIQEGGAGEASQIVALDGVEEGGAGDQGDMNVPTTGSLPKMLFSEGFSVVATGIGAIVKPPKGIWSRSLLLLAYYAAVLVLILFGVWLLKLSFMVAENPNRRTLSKAVMWATLAPLLLVIAFHVLGTN